MSDGYDDTYVCEEIRRLESRVEHLQSLVAELMVGRRVSYFDKTSHCVRTGRVFRVADYQTLTIELMAGEHDNVPFSRVELLEEAR